MSTVEDGGKLCCLAPLSANYGLPPPAPTPLCNLLRAKDTACCLLETVLRTALRSGR